LNNTTLVIAYQGGDGMYSGYTTDGVKWTDNGKISSWSAAHGCCMYNYKGTLFLAYPGADSNFYLGSSTDGKTWVNTPGSLSGWAAW